jgi:Spy/CpxP family protein refolding chaperone
MKRTLIVGILAALTLPVLAQEGQHVPISNPTGSKPMPTFGRSWGSGGTASLLSSAQDVLRSAYVDGVPHAYAVLGLTDEQTKAIEALSKEARAENNETYKIGMPNPGQTRTSEDLAKRYAERKEKQAAISAKYDLRMADVLTAEQKTQLSKIKALAEQKSAEDKKIAETATAAYKEVLETYQKKLYVILPPEQAKKISDEDQSQKQNAGGGNAPRPMAPGSLPPSPATVR